MDRLAKTSFNFVGLILRAEMKVQLKILSSGDAHLYTITSNSVFRIYAPVLDDPAWFQLHSTLDVRVFIPADGDKDMVQKGKVRMQESKGQIWALEADIVREALSQALSEPSLGGMNQKAHKTMEVLLAEETDVVIWLGDDGTIAVRAIMVSEIYCLSRKTAEIQEYGS